MRSRTLQIQPFVNSQEHTKHCRSRTDPGSHLWNRY